MASRIHKTKRAAPSASATQPKPPTDWGDVADWYDQLVGESGSEYHQHVVLPGVLRLLGMGGAAKPAGAPAPAESVIDIACGQGVLCRLLQQRGVEVTGVDAATELIALARHRSGQAIRYQTGDARDLGFLRAASFSAAVCVLAVQNIHPLAGVFDGVYRLLRPGGRFVMAMMHPCFRGPRETSWGWDDAGKVQYRRVDRYLLPRKTPIVTHPGKDALSYTWSFHRPLESYVKSLRSAGLLIDAIEEWPSHKTSTSGPRAPAENVARKEIPMFMAIRALKLAEPSTSPADEALPE